MIESFVNAIARAYMIWLTNMSWDGVSFVQSREPAPGRRMPRPNICPQTGATQRLT
jgi:hypothetical protein